MRTGRHDPTEPTDPTAEICTDLHSVYSATGTVQLVLDSRGCTVFAGEVHENCNGTDTWTWSFSECILGNIRIEIDRAIVDLHDLAIYKILQVAFLLGAWQSQDE